jgi:hypothetical protein
MAVLTDAEIEAAEARGRQMLATEPGAVAARYDRASNRVVIDLANGCGYVFPVNLVPDLRHAQPDALSVITVDGAGFNLHWPALDVDLSVPALVAGLFRTLG